MFLLVLALAGTLTLAHFAPFPFLFDVTTPEQVVWRMPKRGDPPAVYLTFDDGPNPTATPQVLDALRAHDARATFFLIDRHLTPQTAPIVRRMFEEGHGVALHSDDRWLMARSPAGLVEHLRAFAARVEALAGHRPCRAFRPHGGARSPDMLEGLRRLDHQLIGWSWFGWDWNWGRRRTGESVSRRLIERASDGFIMVIHDGHHIDPRADRLYAADAVDRLVPALQGRGFEFRTICEDLERVERRPSRRSRAVAAGEEP